MSRKLRALDLFCGGGGVSVGLARAGFEVVGVDLNPKCEPCWRKGMEPYGGEFVCADALTFPLDGFDLICASPPCQRYSVATRITGRREDHPDLIAPVRERLKAGGVMYAIENVPGAPLGGAHPLVMLCGTMFGLQVPDGRAEIRRHRWFELSWPVLFRPQCQHGGPAASVTGHTCEIPPSGWHRKQALSVTGTGLDSNRERWAIRTGKKVLCVAGGKAMSGGMMTPRGELKRRAMSVTGNTAQTSVVRNQVRETFSIEDARAAMGIDWMPMRFLSQAIPPAYGEWLGRQALEALRHRTAEVA